MKILYVSPYPPARDGIGTYTRHLTGAIQAQGHDIRVIVPRDIPDSPPEVLGSIGMTGRRTGLLPAAVSAWGPDAVHVQFAVAAFGTRTPALLRWLSQAHRDLRTPIVVTMHEVTRDMAILRDAGRALYRSLAGRCDRIIVHTEAARTELTARVGVPPEKTVVIPHHDARPLASDTTPEDLRARFDLDGSRLLLAFGFIHVDKGLDDLVRALGILMRSPAAPAGVRLIVAGTVRRRQGLFRIMELRDRAHLARVLLLARTSGVQRHLTLTGYVPEEEIAGWFGAAEAVVLPYRRAEQSGVASLARAFRVPVLASSAGGLSEQIGGTPWRFPPRDPERLAIVLGQFLNAGAPQRAVASSQRQAVTMTAVAAAMLGVYGSPPPAAVRSLSHAR